VAGLWISNSVHLPIGHGESLRLGPAGTVVVLSVLFFFATVAWQTIGRRQGGPRGTLAVAGAGGENASIAEPAPGRPA
jgi:hypothetical protein